MQAVPGIELVDLKQPALQSVNLAITYKREFKLDELEAAPIISKFVADKKVHMGSIAPTAAV